MGVSSDEPQIKAGSSFPDCLVVFGTLLFIPAGSFRFWQGWVYITTSFVPGLLAFAYFYKHDPQIIERRMQFKEKVREQKRTWRSSISSG